MYVSSRDSTLFYQGFISILSGRSCKSRLQNQSGLACFHNVKINMSMFRLPSLTSFHDFPNDVYSSHRFVDSEFNVKVGVGNSIIGNLDLFLSSVALGVKIIYCKSLATEVYSLGIVDSENSDGFLYDPTSLNVLATILYFSGHFSSVSNGRFG